MLDDSDLDKIVNKIELNRKERNKKDSRDAWFILVGLLIGAAFVLLVVSNFDTDKIAEQSSPTEQEILKIQDLSCFELKHFTPKFANPNFVILEILQRCVN